MSKATLKSVLFLCAPAAAAPAQGEDERRGAPGAEVSAFGWAHVFYHPATGRELKRYRLQSKQRVAAGETAALDRAVFIKPDESTRHLTAGRQRVRLTRVEFDGGGEWRAGGGRKP